MTPNELILIIGMAIVTFAVRYPILALVSRITMPQTMLDALKFIPPAVLTAIVVPSVLMRGGGGINLDVRNEFLIAALAASFVSWWTKSLLLTIVVGLAVLWAWMWLF